jgi:hypothetical protein
MRKDSSSTSKEESKVTSLIAANEEELRRAKEVNLIIRSIYTLSTVIDDLLYFFPLNFKPDFRT